MFDRFQLRDAPPSSPLALDFTVFDYETWLPDFHSINDSNNLRLIYSVSYKYQLFTYYQKLKNNRFYGPI